MLSFNQELFNTICDAPESFAGDASLLLPIFNAIEDAYRESEISTHEYVFTPNLAVKIKIADLDEDNVEFRFYVKENNGNEELAFIYWLYNTCELDENDKFVKTIVYVEIFDITNMHPAEDVEVDPKLIKFFQDQDFGKIDIKSDGIKPFYYRDENEEFYAIPYQFVSSRPFTIEKRNTGIYAISEDGISRAHMVGIPLDVPQVFSLQNLQLHQFLSLIHDQQQYAKYDFSSPQNQYYKGAYVLQSQRPVHVINHPSKTGVGTRVSFIFSASNKVAFDLLTFNPDDSIIYNALNIYAKILPEGSWLHRNTYFPIEHKGRKFYAKLPYNLVSKQSKKGHMKFYPFDEPWLSGGESDIYKVNFTIKPTGMKSRTPNKSLVVRIEHQIKEEEQRKKVAEIYNWYFGKDVKISTGSVTVMTQFDGDLLDYLAEKYTSFTADEILDLFEEMLKQVALFHEKFVHRDIKIENFLMKDGRPFLSDFGFADLCENEHRLIFCGTLLYMAPEVMLYKINFRKSDIYSLGKIFEFILNGSEVLGLGKGFKNVLSQCSAEGYRQLTVLITEKMLHDLPAAREHAKDLLPEFNVIKKRYFTGKENQPASINPAYSAHNGSLYTMFARISEEQQPRPLQLKGCAPKAMEFSL